jgi:hypothetical protein
VLKVPSSPSCKTLVENGTVISLIKELLGHNSIKTTQIYTHVSQKIIEKIRSPFDDLYFFYYYCTMNRRNILSL